MVTPIPTSIGCDPGFHIALARTVVTILPTAPASGDAASSMRVSPNSRRIKDSSPIAAFVRGQDCARVAAGQLCFVAAILVGGRVEMFEDMMRQGVPQRKRYTLM